MRTRMVVVAVVFLLAGAALASAQWQGGGPGRHGMSEADREHMMAMREKLEALNAFDIKTMWAVLSLQVTLDPAELDAMRQTFKDSWTRRTEALAKTNDDTDWGAVQDKFAEMKKDLDGKIKAGISKDELKAYDDGMKEQEKQRPAMPGR